MQFEVNVFGQVAVTRRCCRRCARRAGGSCSSPRSAAVCRCRSTGPTPPPSTRSRRSAMRCAESCYSSNVEVSLVEPGSVKTPIWDKAQRHGECTGGPAGAADGVRTCTGGDRARCSRTPSVGRAARAGGRDDRAGAHRAPSAGALSRRARRPRHGPRPRAAARPVSSTESAPRARDLTAQLSFRSRRYRSVQWI